MNADDTVVYDQMYESNDLTYEHPTTSPYYPMFCQAVERVLQRGISNLLEVGCGSGVLAELVIRTGIAYRGFDVSPVGIEKARKRNPGRDFLSVTRQATQAMPRPMTAYSAARY